jgi:hypothetical protein
MPDIRSLGKCKWKLWWVITSHPLGWLLWTENDKCWGCKQVGTLVYCLKEYKMVQPLWKSVWCLRKKLKIEMPYTPAISLLDIYPKEFKAQS